MSRRIKTEEAPLEIEAAGGQIAKYLRPFASTQGKEALTFHRAGLQG
jgi:hypothetical protein